MTAKQLTKGNTRNGEIRKKKLSVGDICDLKITALAPNNIGIDEFSYPFAIFVPNAKQGNIKAKIVKKAVTAFKDSSYAVAQLISTSQDASNLTKPDSEAISAPVKPGDVLTVNITKKTQKGAGIVELSPDYKIIVPLGQEEVLPKNAKITITRVKSNYAFSMLTGRGSEASISDKIENSLREFSSIDKDKKDESSKRNLNKLMYGCKFTTIIPENVKKYNNYAILKVRDQILFVRLEKGVMLGRDKVRIKVRRDIGNSSFNCAIGKIIQINPVSKNKKATLVMNSIREMLAHGMHFGEKTVKCHARMKQYIWLHKQGQNKNRPFVKKGQHVINLLKTRRCLNKALSTLTKYALKGRTFLFIGTKKPAAGLVARASFFTKNSFYVNTRWLGGMLTNWKTICKSISKIRPILKEKQKVVRDILERRQTIKARFIKRALLLKNKSKLILTKGRQIFKVFKNNTNDIVSRAQKFAEKRNILMTKGMIYIQKRQKLIQKRRELIDQTLFVKEKGLQISSRYQMLFNQLAAYTQKLREYKYLLMLSSEMKGLQKTNVSLYTVPYNTLKNIPENNIKPWIVPNPPKEILNRVALATVRSREADSRLTNEGTDTSRLRTPKATSGNINIVVCSSLLLRFARQLNSYIKSVIETLISSIQSIQTQCNDALSQLKTIETTLQNYDFLKNQYVSELQQLKTKAIGERQVIQIVKRQFKALDAQKKLIKFLPRLRYLPTPQTKISEIVQILLSKIVDPKLKFPIDSIYDKNLSSSTKKLAAARKKKWQRLEKYFGGIANMTKLSQTKISKNVAIIIGQKEEMNAVRECNKLGLKTFTIVDTNCDPTLSDHIIPANDDSRNSIKYILTKFITRIRLAQKIRSRFQKYKKSN
uniref:Small ribosomal subunit protein uS2c n=1 Tax=Dunaliella salina TaxID=3046 RepID=D0FY06_DUNSA|nr:ribosomal protein S2 [Dunaliella salina]ACS95092.1 ribosomal protein S2 [Dunaliella salina]